MRPLDRDMTGGTISMGMDELLHN